MLNFNHILFSSGTSASIHIYIYTGWAISNPAIRNGWTDNSSPDNSSQTIRRRLFVARTIRRTDNSSSDNSSHGQFVAHVINCNKINMYVRQIFIDREAINYEWSIILFKRNKSNTEKQKIKQKNKTIILTILTHLQLSFSNIHQDQQCRNHRLNV